MGSDRKRMKMDIAGLKSFVEVPADSDFPIQNLPYGIFRPKAGEVPRAGVALGEYVVDLSVLAEAGVFQGFNAACFSEPTLNTFMGLGKEVWTTTRTTLLKVLSAEDATIRDNEQLRAKALVPMADVEMELPAAVGGYVDFYAGKQHAINVGTLFRPNDPPLMPNWLRMPIGYNGRASSVTVGSEKAPAQVVRPGGQLAVDPKDHTKGSTYGACRLLDFELEIGVFLGGPSNKLGEPIGIKTAPDHVFGYVLLNDWSARDIQAFEYRPLGPFGSKSFNTSISPWIVVPEALEPFKCNAEKQDPEVLQYLKEAEHTTFDVDLCVYIKADDIGKEPFKVSHSNFKNLYWSAPQFVAHASVTGCNIIPGDLFGSGTISGTDPGSFGSMLELSWRGQKPIQIKEGVERKFLKDGDEVIMTGHAKTAEGVRIGFGNCSGKILPAKLQEF